MPTREEEEKDYYQMPLDAIKAFFGDEQVDAPLPPAPVIGPQNNPALSPVPQSADPLNDLRRQMLSNYLIKIREQQNPQTRHNQQKTQYDREDLAGLGNFAQGMHEAASTIGGTNNSKYLPQTAKRLQAASDLGAKNLNKGSEFDPRIYAALSRKTSKNKEDTFKTQPYTNKYGVEKLGKVNKRTAEFIKSKEDKIVKVPEVQKVVSVMRAEYNKETEAQREVEKTYRVIIELARKAEENKKAGKSTGAYDYQIVKSFEKMQEPNGMVREAEFAAVAGLGGVWDKALGKWGKLKRGDILPDEVRKSIVDSTATTYNVSQDSAKKIRTKHAALAKDYHIPFNLIYTDMGTPNVAKSSSNTVGNSFPMKVRKKVNGQMKSATIKTEAQLRDARSKGWK